ncbi:hypothetical protein PV326_006916, partial [Microctonus aethiopoides]
MYEKKRKQAETERKRAEVRARLEEASKAKKAKKGFMTPDRKKKLRLLLRKKAAEELKKEQERKAAERRRIIEERCGTCKDTENCSEAELQTICTAYWHKLCALEGDKYDLEKKNLMKDFESLIDLRLLIEDLKEICQEYYERVYACEGQKWDLEREVRKRDYE